VKYPNFDLIHSITCFSRIVFDEFIAKGERLCTKLLNSLLKKYDNVYLRGTTYIECVQEEFLEFELEFKLFSAFSLVCCFSCHLLVVQFSLF
jgi:hypothetical protein